MSTPLVQIVRDAFVWRSGMQIDADGSPRAYAPPPLHGIDFLGNAHTDPKDLSSPYCGVVLNAMGVPFVQGPQDPCPGFYVSQTALQDHRFAASDPRRYVDSEKVPYVTLTRDMKSRGAQLGDLAFVLYGAAECAAIVAELGPHPGEGSIALAAALGIPSDPRHGGLSAPAVSFLIFKNSAAGWPRADVAAAARAAFDAWGGRAALAEVLA